jgi:glucose/arabinose dehydrogenase
VALAASGCGDSEDDSATTTAAPPPPAAEPGGGNRNGGPPVGDGEGGVEAVEIGVFDQPVYVAQPPDERDDLYVVEKTGRIVLVRDGEPLPEPFLDIGSEVSTGYEQGLLSMAFAPDYEDSGRFYVDYTDAAGDSRIVEYRRSESDPDAADPESRRELLLVDQPYPNHNGGQLQFGPDELLYVGFGDGGGGGDPMGNGQNLGALLGKILRIDPRASAGEPYSIPETNPFANGDGARPEVYSYGLRNPWRFSFDRLTGALAIGDVGQSAIEEVDLVGRGEGSGANFGWSAFEGTEPYNEDQDAPGHVPPVLEYALDGGACAVTGGYVVRDETLRSLYGRYLYADFCLGELRSFAARPGRDAGDDRALGVQVPMLSSFAEDSSGRIYVVSLEGPVYRLTPSGG